MLILIWLSMIQFLLLLLVIYSSMNCTIYLITFRIVQTGRLVLCVPLNISRYFFGPQKHLQSFSELVLSISRSSSPFMNITMVYLLILRTSLAISSSSISQPPLSLISERSLEQMHGKKQSTRQFGTYLGDFYLAVCLQRPRKERKEESAIMIGALPYFKAVAAPMLLPQSTTLHF